VLILSRKPGDAIVIEGGIRIVILASDKRGVRIGIDAPSDVSIVREEILTQVAAQNRRAPASDIPADVVRGLIAQREPPAAAPAAGEAK